MEQPHWAAVLTEAYNNALGFLTALPHRPLGTAASRSQLRDALAGPLPEKPADPVEVVAALAAAAEPGLMGTQSGRFFGFVVGGAAPAALAADWLTSTWDQNAGLFVLSPAASVVEEVAGEWMAALLGLPATVSVGFVTGGQMANMTALAAARHEVLRRYGWDVEADGLIGAPRIAGARRCPAARHDRPCIAVSRPGPGRDRPGAHRRPGTDAAAGIGGCALRWRRADHRVCPGWQCQHGRDRSRGRDLRHRSPGRRLGSRRRGLRPLGRRESQAART